MGTPSDPSTGVLEDPLDALRQSRFAEPIEAFTQLLSQTRRAFLIGAGCSRCAGLPLMDELTKEILEATPKETKQYAILEKLVGRFRGGHSCTIEDYMSELVDLLSLAERREIRMVKESTVQIEGSPYGAADLRDALAGTKAGVKQAIGRHPTDVTCHREFIRAIHGRLLAGRSELRCPVDYFTLNYDTLLEDALCLERIPTVDGFRGGATGWWDPETYKDPRAQARVFKIHGSIDWCLLENDDVLPRRIREGLCKQEHRDSVMIWPASTKYREAQRDPYAQILEMTRGILRASQNRELVLAVIGYSFSDAHINFEIDRALRESEGRLTILVFLSADVPEGICKEWLEDAALKEHVRIHTKRGFFHADANVESDRDLPWWKFEVLARLLRGER